MLKQLSVAAGYLAMLLVPALLLLGIHFRVPSLAFGFVMFVIPLARPVFGKLSPAATPIWGERVASLLERLPLLYAAALTIVVGFALRYAGSSSLGGRRPSFRAGPKLVGDDALRHLCRARTDPPKAARRCNAGPVHRGSGGLPAACARTLAAPCSGWRYRWCRVASRSGVRMAVRATPDHRRREQRLLAAVLILEA